MPRLWDDVFAPIPDPLAADAAKGALNLASWRVWSYYRLRAGRDLLLGILVDATDFAAAPEKPLLAQASKGDAAAMRQIAKALAESDTPSDLAWSWATAAALYGDTVACHAVAGIFISDAQHARGRKARDLWRVVQTWALTVKLADLTSDYGNQLLIGDLENALRADNPPAAKAVCPKGPSPALMTAPGLTVVASDIPKDGDSKTLVPDWEFLTHPLPLATGPEPEVLRSVLNGEFPWLHAAVDALISDLELRRSAGLAWIRWRPTLLVGPPGTGKTRLARRIAELCGVGFGEVNAAGSSDNRLLQGTARGWSSANPSQVLHVMRQSRTANPVMLVDEVDKATGTKNGDIRATLLTMLEPITAKSWPDETLMVPCDLSAVNWLLCANCVDRLRGPLLTRLRVVQAPPPTVEHFDVVLNGVLREIAAALGVGVRDLPDLPTKAVERLRNGFARGLSLRRVHAAVEAAMKAGGGLAGRMLH